MKKLVTLALVVLCIGACTQNDTKTEMNTHSTESMPMPSSDADKREKEINDSTKMLDKKLADPADTTSPGGN
jgi:hypothetical protein